MSDEFDYDYDATEETGEGDENCEDEEVKLAGKVLAENEEKGDKPGKKVIAGEEKAEDKLHKQVEAKVLELTPEQMTLITQKKLAAALKEADAAWENLPQANRDQVNSIIGLRGNVAEYTSRLSDPKVPQEDRVIAKAKLVNAQADLDRQWGALTPKQRAIVDRFAIMQANINEYATRLTQKKK